MSWSRQPLMSVVCDATGGHPKLLRSKIASSGRFPVIDQGRQSVAGYCDDESLLYRGPLPVVLFGDHTREIKYAAKPFVIGADGVKVLAPAPEINARYLFYFLKHDGVPSVGYSRHFKFLRDKNVPIPPTLAEQQRIVELLEAADYLCSESFQLRVRIESAFDPIFRRCFGENFPHEADLPRKQLFEVADVVSGVTKGRTLNGSKLHTVAYMRVANVQDGHIALDDVKTIEATDQEIAQYALQPDDILLTEGGDPDKLGRGAIWDGSITPCIHQNHIFRVRITKDELLPEYLSALFSSAYGKSYFLRMAKQTTGIASMNIGQLKQFPVVMASRDKQIEFKRLQAQFDEIKARLAKQAATLETLFQTLLQRAFDSRLTAKWREVHAKELLEEMQLQSRGS